MWWCVLVMSTVKLYPANMNTQEIGKTALGVVLGLMLGVVLYQSSRISVGVNQVLKGKVFADISSSWSSEQVCGATGGGFPNCGGTCGTPGWVCEADGVANACVCRDPGVVSSSYSSGCGGGQITCGGNCCDFDTQYCDMGTETCIDRTSSSYSSPPPPPPSSSSSSFSSDPSSSSFSSDPCASSAAST